MSAARSTVLGLVAVTVVVTVPGLALVVAGRSDVASVTALAAIAGLIPALTAGPRVAVGTAAAVGIGSAVAVAATDQPWLAALLMAAAGGAVGLSARLGAQRFVTMGPISLVFLIAEPPMSAAGAPVPPTVVGAVALGSALWAALAGSVLMRSRKRPDLQQLSWFRSGGYAVVLALAVGAASWVMVDRQLGHGGAWFVMTLIIVLQPYLQDAWRKTLERALGTVIGFAIALLAYTIIDAPAVLYVLSAVFTVLALVAMMVKHRPYWQFVALLTPAIVLLEGESGSVVDTAIARLGFTLLGAAVAVAIELALAPPSRALARRYSLDHY